MAFVFDRTNLTTARAAMEQDFSIELQRSTGCSLEMRYRPWHTLSYYPAEVRVQRAGPKVRSDQWQARDHLAIYPSGVAEHAQWSGACDAMHLHIAPLTVTNREGTPVQLERRDPVNDADLLSMMQAIYEECRGVGQAGRAQLTALVNQVRSRLSRDAPTLSGQVSIGCRGLDEVLAEMLNPSSARIGRDELARSCRVSATFFNRRFRSLFGTSPHDYLLNTRVELAKCHIFNGGTSLAEIALAAGFCDQAHLARQFRRRTGMTASQFRQHFER